MRGWGVTCGALLLAACAGRSVPVTRPPDIVPGAPATPRPAPPAPRPPAPPPVPEAPESPPPVVAERPPYLVLIPGSEVFYAPEQPVDLFFYNGLWFTRHGGRWFYAADYTGPWTYLSPRGVPPALDRLPAEYRGAPAPPRGGSTGPG
ncbi:MAG TPA: hypothetical protein VFV36_06120 [Candidatus Methylomirabilis sp.]|nr:hypothetical protein [Candidatus Methylomirabilis sp.]